MPSRARTRSSCRSSALTCGAFVEQLLNVSGDYEGLTGIAVYNPAAVGGAGVKLALQLLNGETVETGENNTVLLPAPEAWDNVSEEGKAKLAEINEPDHRPAVSGQLVHRRLDRLHPGRDVGLQGSGRVVLPAILRVAGGAVRGPSCPSAPSPM